MSTICHGMVVCVSVLCMEFYHHHFNVGVPLVGFGKFCTYLFFLIENIMKRLFMCFHIVNAETHQIGNFS